MEHLLLHLSFFCKVCGKCGKTFTHTRIQGHEDSCQGETARATCKEDHEHEPMDERFDTLAAAVAFYYDNMLDAEFSVRGGGKIGKSGWQAQQLKKFFGESFRQILIQF